MSMRMTWAQGHAVPGAESSGGRTVAGGRPWRERGWRSHTFADGVRALTLTGPLDVGTAGRLWARIAEQTQRGCRRLIVDASEIAPAGEQPALLASVFAGRSPSLDAVVVAPSGSALGDLLPATVGVALSLDDARRQLERGLVRREIPADRGSGRGPAGRIPPGERHALAVRQSLRWAHRCAREGDYERALGWLAMVERIDGSLPDEWRRQRQVWQAAWRAQVRQPCPGRRQGSRSR